MTAPEPPPKKSEKRQRTEVIFARVTPGEKAAVTARADRAGMATAAFMRALALNSPGPRAQRRPPADHKALRQLLGELGRVGNNINQIARVLNATSRVDPDQLAEALGAYLELRNAIFAALNMDTTGHDHQGRQPRGA
jgi:hypothetical protein